MRRLLPAVLLAATALVLPAAASAAATIETTGSATVTVPNDLASLSAGVGLRRPTPQAALRAAGARTRRLLGAIKAAGVAARDIQTSTLSVHPTIRRLHKRRVRQYVADSTLDVTVRDVTKVGAVLAAAVNGGATSVSGPDFSLADPDASYERALVKAFAQARAKAQVLAQQAALTLGKATTINEGSTFTSSGGEGAAPTPARQAPAPPTSPGTTEVDADVDIVFAAS